MLKFYLDTGALVKLYILEPGSEWVQLQISDKCRLVLNPLQQSEMTNAILAAGGRGFISSSAMRKTLRNFDQDLQEGRFLREMPEWSDVWKRTDQLAREHTPKVLCRTLDILHVAIAGLTGSDVFITGDKRQIALCNKIAIPVREIPPA